MSEAKYPVNLIGSIRGQKHHQWKSIILSWVNILSFGVVFFSVYVEVGLKLPLFWSRGLSVLSLLLRWTSSLRLIHVFTQFLGPRLNPPPRPTPSASRQIIAADQRLPLWSWPACLWSAETRCKCSAVIALFHSAGLQHHRPPPWPVSYILRCLCGKRMNEVQMRNVRTGVGGR